MSMFPGSELNNDILVENPFASAWTELDAATVRNKELESELSAMEKQIADSKAEEVIREKEIERLNSLVADRDRTIERLNDESRHKSLQLDRLFGVVSFVGLVFAIFGVAMACKYVSGVVTASSREPLQTVPAMPAMTSQANPPTSTVASASTPESLPSTPDRSITHNSASLAASRPSMPATPVASASPVAKRTVDKTPQVQVKVASKPSHPVAVAPPHHIAAIVRPNRRLIVIVKRPRQPIRYQAPARQPATSHEATVMISNHQFAYMTVKGKTTDAGKEAMATTLKHYLSVATIPLSQGRKSPTGWYRVIFSPNLNTVASIAELTSHF